MAIFTFSHDVEQYIYNLCGFLYMHCVLIKMFLDIDILVFCSFKNWVFYLVIVSVGILYVTKTWQMYHIYPH